jgi:serine/threonine protein kinase
LKVGTPLYTSPEQERGGSYDSKTDIYSLGLIFCEMLCVFGTIHERYQTLTRLREHHEVPAKIFDRYEKYSEGLKEIILNMTQKAPGDRPTAEVLLKDVDKLRGK